MIAVELLHDKKAIEKFLSGLTLRPERSELPLFSEDRFDKIFVCLKENGNCIGFVYGISDLGCISLNLASLYVQDTHRTQANVLFLLDSSLKLIMDSTRINEVTWAYDYVESVINSKEWLIMNTQYSYVKSRVYVNRYMLNTNTLDNIKVYNKSMSARYQYYWKNSGYKAIMYADCKPDFIAMVRAEEKRDTHGDYLSPFIEDEDPTWRCDENTSYILSKVNNGIDEPVGWVMCHRIDEKKVKIMRYYMHKEKRRGFMGTLFLMNVLKSISIKYEHVYFDVVKGNRQMETFIKNIGDTFIRHTGTRCVMNIGIVEDMA